MITKLKSGIEELRENFNKELESVRKNLADLKNIVTQIKNTRKGISSRLSNTEQWMRDLEDRLVEIN